MAKEIVAMILAGGRGSRLYALTQKTAKPAVGFGGKYRIVDFPLSNCVNSDIDTVGIATQYQPQKLNEYIGNGQPWDLDRLHGGVHTLPPYEQANGTDWYKGTANAIYQNIGFIDSYDPEYVIILSGDQICKQDYADFLRFHKEKGAEFSVAVMEVDWKEASRFGLMVADENDRITEFHPVTGAAMKTLNHVAIYPASHYVASKEKLQRAMVEIQRECDDQVAFFRAHDKLIEAQRIAQRTNYDIEMLNEVGICKGIENYSRYLTGRPAGAPPPTLFEYLPPNAIIFIDESHISVPQIGGMYRGDYNRKSTLADYGFRLPSCVDNRPLKFDEWNAMRGQTIFVSATPGDWELEQSGGSFVEQVIRPTGLADPVCVVRPVENQIDDLMEECRKVIAKGERVLVTTLTKKMAEDLTEYLNDNGIKVRYLHSDIDTLERIEIIRDLRLGVFDVLVGINLLREGLDIPECSLVAILDADKEGFLRSTRSLIQTIGRAARNAEGKVILYADKITGSIKQALDETQRRREKQMKYNAENGITPKTIKKSIRDLLEITGPAAKDERGMRMTERERKAEIDRLEKEMRKAAQMLEYEYAAVLRDQIIRLRGEK